MVWIYDWPCLDMPVLLAGFFVDILEECLGLACSWKTRLDELLNDDCYDYEDDARRLCVS